jgi:hypothetical protein
MAIQEKAAQAVACRTGLANANHGFLDATRNYSPSPKVAAQPAASNSRPVLRLATLEDVSRIAELEREVWGGQGATGEAIAARIALFQEGNIVALKDGRLVGYLAIQLVDDLTDHPAFTWAEITDNGKLTRSHRPDGEYLYGVNLSVHYSVRSEKVSYLLLLRGWHLALSKNKKGCFLGSRIQGFRNYRERHPAITAEDYCQVRRPSGRLRDYELNMYQKAGAKIVKLLPGYFPDAASLDYGVLCLIGNSFYNWPFRCLLGKLLVKLSPLIVRVL